MNTLTDLTPDLYAALDVVSRELTGFIPAVTLDASVSRAAIGQTVRSFATQAQGARDIVPSNIHPNDGDQTVDNVELTIKKSRVVPIKWNGEEQLGLDNNGPGTGNVLADQIMQGMRTLANEMEADLSAETRKFSRAFGTAGTLPLGTPGDYSDASFTRKILADNGAPMGDMHFVVGTDVGANIRGKQAEANQAGSDSILRQGVLLDIGGMMVRESAQVEFLTAGDAAGATTDNAGYAVGAKTITLAAAGTGEIKAGDVITFAGDTNKYIVETGLADVSAGGDIVLGGAGLRVEIGTSATAITVGADSTRHAMFSRNALLLATRLPAQPQGGDEAVASRVLTDPRTGMSFEVREYAGYHQRRYEVGAAWGANLVKGAHGAILLG